jgi:hypothetical protein
MKTIIPLIVLLSIMSAVAGAESTDLIPRRVRFDADIPEDAPAYIFLTPDLLLSEIVVLQVIIPADIEQNRVDVISISVDDRIMNIRLEAEGIDPQFEVLYLEDLGNLDDLELACRDLAKSWAPYLGLVAPEVEELVITQERKMTEELIQEKKLSTPFQIILWAPSFRTSIDTEDQGGSYLGFSFMPVIFEFQWYFKSNFGMTASLYLEYSSFYQVGYDSSELNLFILPGLGITYRTIGRLSGEFGAGLYYGPARLVAGEDIPELGLLAGDVLWTAIPLLDLHVVLSWNFTDKFSAKMKTGLSLMFDGQAGGYNTIPVVIVQLGAGYRW